MKKMGNRTLFSHMAYQSIALKMKLTLVLFSFPIFQMMATSGFSQGKIELNFEEAPILEILDEIKNQTSYKFFYINDEVNLNQKTTIRVDKVTLGKVLELLFDNTDISYSVIGKQVILKKTPLLDKMVKPQREVKGNIKDSNGSPLPGANVLVKGTTNGAQTDFDGNFTINLPDENNILIISYLGFETTEIDITGKDFVDVQLKSAAAQLEDVVLVGTRNPNRTATETAVPIDIVDISEITTQGPQVNLNQILNYVAPSFTSNTQTISDGTDHIDPASLRGLGPDQVLVLINGKRRHNSSLVNVNGTFGRGSVGTDLNAIPAVAIKRIEVLRDGAAAQYGSDAIAGVINIVLNNKVNELDLKITSGANFSKNANDQTGGVDGETINVSASYGLPIGENGGFINFSGDFDYREDYGRMKEWGGNVFNLYNTVERFATNDGASLSDLLDDDVADVIQYANAAGINLNGASTKPDLQAILSADNTEAELSARGLTRSDFNMRIGQSALRGGRFFANMGIPLDDKGTKLYSFAGIGSRVGNSAGFYRLPNQSRTYTPTYFNGFLPEINSRVNDKSVSVGIKGKISDWDIDFSNTWGKNAFLYTIGNTLNASLQSASPTTFDAGGFEFSQNTINLDLNRFYEDVFSGLNIALGSEYRVENYEIVAGEEQSYSQYTDEGAVITLASQDPSRDFFGNARPGGAQVFPGFSPDNALVKDRNSIAAYVDVEADLSEAFLLSFATRFENYSDFGSTINFKLASLFKVSDNFNLRGALNTGFRAPSLHQLNFNSTSTIFDNNGDPQEVGTFSNDSRAAKLLGIPELKEETSRSVSIGFTAKVPSVNLTFTIDGYYIGIDDRVVYTGQFEGPGTGTDLDNLLSEANATAASFFANAIDTESKGIDLVVTHTANLGTNTKLKSDLSATLSKTEKIGDIKASEVLENAGLVDTYFPEDSRVYLEEAVPRTKVVLSNALSINKLNLFLRNVYFGEVTEATTTIENQQVFGSKVVTDLSLGYNFSESMTITIGANNLLDIYPDRAEDQFNNRSNGRFDWSRRAQQFGIGGRFLFARLNFKLK